MELVLIALCGCTASDVVGILRKKREPFTALEVRRAASARRIIRRFTQKSSLVYRIAGKVSRKAVEDAVRLSKEKYCSVSAMLEKTRQDYLEDRAGGIDDAPSAYCSSPNPAASPAN